MALDKTTLKNSIISILNNMSTLDESTAEVDVVNQFATQLSDAIDAFVKSGDGKYQAGTLTAGATVVTAVGTGPTIKIT